MTNEQRRMMHGRRQAAGRIVRVMKRSTQYVVLGTLLFGLLLTACSTGGTPTPLRPPTIPSTPTSVAANPPRVSPPAVPVTQTPRAPGSVVAPPSVPAQTVVP